MCAKIQIPCRCREYQRTFSKENDAVPLPGIRSFNGFRKNGDTIIIDAEKNELSLVINEHEMERRLEKWQQPAPRYTRGVLAKYAKLVSSASLGAVTDNLD